MKDSDIEQSPQKSNNLEIEKEPESISIKSENLEDVQSTHNSVVLASEEVRAIYKKLFNIHQNPENFPISFFEVGIAKFGINSENADAVGSVIGNNSFSSLQRALVDTQIPGTNIEVDGDIGQMTLDAVLAFQEYMDIPRTGYFDLMTIDRLASFFGS